MKIENNILYKVFDEDIINGTTTIPDSVISIGYGAFEYCDSLTSITIPDGVTSIGGSAFWRCKNLTSVTISNSVTSIGDEAFQYCEGLTSIIIGNNVAKIGDGAFYGCSSLKSIEIPDSVMSIGRKAFADCTNLIKSGNFKATCADMTCIGFTYNIGKTYKKDRIKLCYAGFHYCENAFDLFNYYHGEIGTDLRLFEVEPGNISEETHPGDSKRVCGKIKLLREIKSYGELLN